MTVAKLWRKRLSRYVGTCLMRIGSDILSIYNVFLPSSCAWNSLKHDSAVYLRRYIRRSYLHLDYRIISRVSAPCRRNPMFVAEYIRRLAAEISVIGCFRPDGSVIMHLKKAYERVQRNNVSNESKKNIDG